MLFLNHPELLQAFRRGQRDALAVVYRDYVAAVEKYLHAVARATGREELTQAAAISDLLQEVFARAFSARQRAGYDGLRAYRPYLLGIARNCIADVIRGSGREVLKDPIDVSLEGHLPEVETPTWNDPSVARALGQFLASVPVKLRAVCEQRFVLERSQAEVSGALGLSRKELRTAEKRLRRGLRRALVQAGISLREVRLTAKEGPERASSTNL